MLKVHVGTPVDQCIANNEARMRRRDALQEKAESHDNENEPKEASTTEADPQVEAQRTTQPNGLSTAEDTEEPYPPDLLKNLIFRYEEPSTHSRWDKPLFTVPWSDPEPPIAEIWTALTGIPHPSSTSAETPVTTLTDALSSSALLSDTASINTSATARTPRTAALQRPKIKPHQATVQPTATDSSALYAMEKRTSAIVTAIRSYTLTNPSAEAALAQSPDARGIAFPVPEASTPIFIPAHVATSGSTDELAGAGGILALPRLQRLRRQWIGLNRAYIGGHASAAKGGLAPEQVGDAFVRFLNAEFAGETGV
jgi:protein KTI12